MRKLMTEELHRMTVDDFKTSEKLPLTVILDNIRSLHNVGSVFRTADAFRIEQIYLCGITACPPMPEIHKTALGAEDSVDWKYYEDTLDAVEQLKKNNYCVLAVEQVEQSSMLHHLELNRSKRYALILGNEVKGVRQDVVDVCDGAVEIPQFGTKHSLNVSVSGGIVLWEFARQLEVFDVTDK